MAVLAPETERRQPAGEAPGRQADAALPVAGERWVYRSRGKWPTSPQRSFEIVARSVDAGVIVDAFRPIEPDSRTAGELRRSRAGRPEFVVWTEIGTEFSPYFGGFVERADRQTLRGLATPDVGSYWTQWHSEATIRGPEAVSVPAGNFQAVKVEVWSSRRATGSVAEAQLEPVRIHYLVWYVPEIKRYVKMQRRIISATNSENEKDVFELVAYRRP